MTRRNMLRRLRASLRSTYCIKYLQAAASTSAGDLFEGAPSKSKLFNVSIPPASNVTMMLRVMQSLVPSASRWRLHVSRDMAGLRCGWCGKHLTT